MSTSLFEIVGPVMVGPSSSHTAGMARIGVMAGRIAGFEPERIVLRLSPTLRTTYHGHRTDASLIGGALGWAPNDPKIKHALSVAAERGIDVKIAFFPPNIYHPNTVQLEMTSGDGEALKVRGISVGGGSIVIDAIDDCSLQLDPALYHMVVWGDGAEKAVRKLAEGLDPKPVVQGAAGVWTVSSVIPVPGADKAENELNAMPGIEKVSIVAPVLEYGATISEKYKYSSCEELIAACRSEGISLSEAAQRYEEDRSGHRREQIRALMHEQLDVMREAVRHGLEEPNEMLYGLTSGEDGKRMLRQSQHSISGGIVPLAAAKALAVMEHNASMGCIVAAPTAGSAGIVPGCMLALQDQYGFSDDRIVDAMFVSAVLGVIMAHRDISFSGSVGGCQAEVGVSAGIAAAGIASLFSEEPEVPVQAMAMCIKNMLGLICDPIAGPIEVPCIKRNAGGVANAFISADMACAGIESYLPPDQVLDALLDVEKRLPGELRCTTTGGLACAAKAVCLRKELEKELDRELDREQS
ncbi:MAG: L-serine ammonia-lyase, iron-sulfur-dependent, subunit alpha [Eubacteriales bacterium]|nr:L-serine ammonia-lyase, iron-sulfur-dependent, subunit alpha [Eubacteriales bacterium]